MSIVKLLNQRELNPQHSIYNSRSFYNTILYPNKTYFNVNAPPVIFKRFSPDGQHLIGFSQHNHVFQVYEYQGLTDNITSENVFDKTLIKKYEKSLTNGTQILCKDFCMFTIHGFMMLASVEPCLETIENESLPNSLGILGICDDVTFWMIDIKSGTVVGTKELKQDRIFLSNHAGVHMYNDLFAIASIQNQCIYLCHLTLDGSIIDVSTIGWNLLPDDDGIFMKYEESEMKFHSRKKSRMDTLDECVISDISSHSSPIVDITSNSSTKKPMSLLMHRIMAFIYRRCKKLGNLNHFHLTFGYFESLILWRVAFMDSETLMIKFGSRESIVGTHSEPSVSQTCFCVIYNYKTTQIKDIYDNGSIELMELFKKSEMNVGSESDSHMRFITSAANNVYARTSLDILVQQVQKAKNGGMCQAVKRVLASVPYNPQCFNPSPLFDHSLFNWDDKLISSFERVRPCTEFPIKFYCRKTNQFKFKLDFYPAPYGSSTDLRNSRKFFLCVFHPTDPFILSTQYGHGSSNNINIHLRYPSSLTP